MTAIRIVLADDHGIVRQGVRRIIETDSRFLVVAEASSGLEAVQMAEEHQPDVAILDIAMQDLNGLAAATQIQRCSPQTAVLVLSMYGDEQYITRAMKAGARGYLMKDVLESELLQAILVVHSGDCFFSPSVARKVAEGYARALTGQALEDRYEALTDRERQIYQMLAEGKGNKDIASRLNISVYTVETHRVRIMNKMNVHSIAELVLDAVRRGIVK
jgi:DNA-binding NarL/FixJ family response regulator